MSVLNLEKLRATPLETDPFDFIVVPDIFTRETVDTVNADYPASESAANHAL